MPLTKIYVGNIAYAAKEEEIRSLFLPYGTIEDLAMAEDRETGKFRGFAIVMMPEKEEAERAIAGVDGHRLRGRRLVVNLAVKKKAAAESEKRTVGASAGAGMPRRVRVASDGRNPRRSSGGRNPRRGR
ncbi:MAG: RNA-binding protein [Phycisphaerales bacterium]|nr:RNA-binding protein [Phycisphaerales bacterium]